MTVKGLVIGELILTLHIIYYKEQGEWGGTRRSGHIIYNKEQGEWGGTRRSGHIIYDKEQGEWGGTRRSGQTLKTHVSLVW